MHPNDIYFFRSNSNLVSVLLKKTFYENLKTFGQRKVRVRKPQNGHLSTRGNNYGIILSGNRRRDVQTDMGKI